MKRKIFKCFPGKLAVLLLLIILVTPAWCFAEELEFTFQNSYDKTQQKAAAYIPEICKTQAKSPLLVIAHYMGGNRFTARNGGYYPECDSRGWLVVCPELHGRRTGGETSLASLGAQHDIIDSVNYMKLHYKVDAAKIYLDGRSMGGMMAGMMAAKYPDVFAAAMSGQGISDLKLWWDTTIPSLRQSVEKECGPWSEAVRFDYERRSSISYAPNFQYVPFMLWHGTSDTWVPPEQSERLVAAIRTYNRFQPDANWLLCASHCPANYSPKWICDQFTYYENICEAGFQTPTRFFPELTIVTDEAKSFYWLGITPLKDDAFARVEAGLANGILKVKTDNVKEITINLDQISRLITFTKYDINAKETIRLAIVKDGKTLFETTAGGRKSGTLPETLFKK
ncbi:MAG: prolyl oligopeptidase family serine peptidase [Candidatus Latescibacter sp.]|nr:prolyl oligopeptidase family serine peptidase [Candidatus Latescibacter sp.]